ncbi:E3 ubiquitin-protein ligase UBR2 isoform X3, partial [Lates japonicus]
MFFSAGLKWPLVSLSSFLWVNSAPPLLIELPLRCLVLCAQAGASMMDPNHFLMIVLSRFELFHIFSSADVRKRYREANKDVVQQNNTLIEEMLHLIIMVVGERYVAGVGQV